MFIEVMGCICGHDERMHASEPSPYPCRNCECRHFRWDVLNWGSPQLVAFQQEREAS